MSVAPRGSTRRRISPPQVGSTRVSHTRAASWRLTAPVVHAWPRMLPSIAAGDSSVTRQSPSELPFGTSIPVDDHAIAIAIGDDGIGEFVDEPGERARIEFEALLVLAEVAPSGSPPQSPRTRRRWSPEIPD